jgi:glyoxylase-like metal-dependent hydrolase (beta-lactamase superfamily II)
MIIKRFVGGTLESNGYVINVKDCNDCYIIDPGYNSQKFIDYVKENKLNPLGILFTHHHYDHITAAPKVAEELECKMYIHKNDFDSACKTLKKASENLEFFDSNHIFKLGNIEIEAINTQGHTRGGVCFVDWAENIAFTGDTVFSTEIGITDLEDGSSDDMARSCKMIATWPKAMKIYPGHGESATIKDVIEKNPEFDFACKMEI